MLSFRPDFLISNTSPWDWLLELPALQLYTAYLTKAPFPSASRTSGYRFRENRALSNFRPTRKFSDLKDDTMRWVVLLTRLKLYTA